MARYTGPVCKLCRREGTKLYLKGVRCNTAKCSVEKRKYAPGQHGQGFRKKANVGYGLHLREKQKARRIYGVLEKQFRKYFAIAAKATGVTGDNLIKILERRLDNVVYRMGFAPSRSAARQLIRHGHVIVNKIKVDVPSYLVRANEIISIKEKSRSLPLIAEAADSSSDVSRYEWLSVDKNSFTGTFLCIPSREQIPVEIDDRLIVEFYSK